MRGTKSKIVNDDEDYDGMKMSERMRKIGELHSQIAKLYKSNAQAFEKLDDDDDCEACT